MALGLSGGFSSVFVRGVSSGRTTDNDFSFSPAQGDSRSYGLLSLARSALPGLAVWKRTGVGKIRALHFRYCTHNHIRNICYFTLPQHSNLQSSWSVTILEKTDFAIFCISASYSNMHEYRNFHQMIEQLYMGRMNQEVLGRILLNCVFLLGFTFYKHHLKISVFKKNHIPLKLS